MFWVGSVLTAHPAPPPATERDTFHSLGCSFSLLGAVIYQELFPSGAFSIHFLAPLIFLAAKSRVIFLLSVGSEGRKKKVLQERGMLRKWEQRRSEWICSNTLGTVLCFVCSFLDRCKRNLPAERGRRLELGDSQGPSNPNPAVTL